MHIRQAWRNLWNKEQKLFLSQSEEIRARSFLHNYLSTIVYQKTVQPLILFCFQGIYHRFEWYSFLFPCNSGSRYICDHLQSKYAGIPMYHCPVLFSHRIKDLSSRTLRLVFSIWEICMLFLFLFHSSCQRLQSTNKKEIHCLLLKWVLASRIKGMDNLIHRLTHGSLAHYSSCSHPACPSALDVIKSWPCSQKWAYSLLTITQYKKRLQWGSERTCFSLWREFTKVSNMGVEIDNICTEEIVPGLVFFR